MSVGSRCLESVTVRIIFQIYVNASILFVWSTDNSKHRIRLLLSGISLSLLEWEVIFWLIIPYFNYKMILPLYEQLIVSEIVVKYDPDSQVGGVKIEEGTKLKNNRLKLPFDSILCGITVFRFIYFR